MSEVKLPPPVRAVLTTLRFSHGPDRTADHLAGLSETDWLQALAFLRPHLVLLLRAKLVEKGAWALLPPTIRARLDRNLADNAQRYSQTQGVLAEIADRLSRAGVEFLLLKGLSHSPAFFTDPRLRLQYDIDLYCPPEVVLPAQDILLNMGYEPLVGLERLPIDHLPTLVRKTGWRWRGNSFDPEIPPAVELHFQFWDPGTERLRIPRLHEFWSRRVEASIAGCRVFQLDRADQLGYAALHLLRHLLRGSLRLHHVYEIASFLHNQKDDVLFWAKWRELHAPDLRVLESISFRLAQTYFGAPVVAAEPLPARVEGWLGLYAWSPVEALLRPNKHELYLHLSLLQDWRDKWQVARRRLLPLTFPHPVQDLHVPEEQMTAPRRLRNWAKYFGFLASRAIHHARVLLPTIWGLIVWRARLSRSAP